MSDKAIGVIAEGITDFYIIEAALNAILTESFTVNLIQPEEPMGCTGGGWPGVYRWCRQVSAAGGETLASSPLLSEYDIIIIHLDADVSTSQYSDGNITDNPNNDLPCQINWPPICDTIDRLVAVVEGWLSPLVIDPHSVLCIPSFCTESWVAVGVFGKNDRSILNDIEFYDKIYQYLHGMPSRQRLVGTKDGKFKKNTQKYKVNRSTITENWDFIKEHCLQARDFSNSVELSLL
ncbi:conserved hypothetical protein [Solidesulfovibrio fructosivorans JJ]]|uniref:Uncharacterized protein n=1 Tax=Solidesulfovibrio fructosivorans JJ] TaxID=596151 RepID=E1JQZ0_SOLFR|nr:hypothetical protein [Solidesulfovibrio fructosivorans]EFL52991.1 conserved hypothetical protein [Solidesulfovibrio fructosivorans JJ]]